MDASKSQRGSNDEKLKTKKKNDEHTRTNCAEEIKLNVCLNWKIRCEGDERATNEKRTKIKVHHWVLKSRMRSSTSTSKFSIHPLGCNTIPYILCTVHNHTHTHSMPVYICKSVYILIYI